jgi:hydroxymethylbilane synthase
VTAERAVLAGLGSGCNYPLGTLAEVVEDLDDEGRPVEGLSLRAVAATVDGALVRASITGNTSEAESLGHRLATELLDLGADPRAVAGDPAHRWIGSS